MNNLSIQVASVAEIFDPRDSSPMSSRQLNPELVDYILERMEEFPKKEGITLRFVCQNGAGQEKLRAVAAAVRARLTAQHARTQAKLVRNTRTGRVMLAIALAVMLLTMGLSTVVGKLPLGDFQYAISEGLIILGWVALWRPAESLLYDWWPIAQERNKLKRLLEGTISVEKAETA